MLDKVVIENFKCFREKREFTFSKINLVHGKAGSGKSSIVHALKLCIKSFLLDPILKDPDYAVDEIRELLPDKDITKRLHIRLEGSILLPYVNKKAKYDIDLTLSVSDGTLSTGIEIEEAKITRSEMLQAMFSYIIKEYNYDKYTIKIEAHYLSHCVYNLKVVYPRITIMDRELFIVLYQEIFPNMLREYIKIITLLHNIAQYSILPTIDDPLLENYRILFSDPHVKCRVSKLLSEIYNREIVIDIRRLKNRDEYVIEDLSTGRPTSSYDSTFRSLLNICTSMESLREGGTLIIDDYDAMLSGDILNRATSIIVKRALERDIQLIITLRHSRNIENIVNSIGKEDVNVICIS